MVTEKVQEVGEFIMAEAIESTYFDTCEVWRMADVDQLNGSVKQQRTRIYTGVPCGFSQGSTPAVNTMTEDSYTQGETVNRVKTQDKLYLNTSYEVRQGDSIIITHFGRTIKTTAGNPFLYDSHQVLYVEGTTYA